MEKVTVSVVAAGGTTIFNPFSGLAVSVTCIVPPEDPMDCEVTEVADPEVTVT
jgi:hypothetical protein